MKIHSSLGLASLLLALVLAAGCGKKEEAKAKTATQVAAKVNSEEITVHQINSILARSPNVTPETGDRAKHEILDKLIEQHLARQEAVEMKLDRSPTVMQAVETARSEILARAYLEQLAAKQPKPTAEEIKKYYAEHPELFAQRRIFNVEEIVVLPKVDLAAGLREQVAKARTLQDIAAWLKSQNVQFAANQGVRAAEAIPMELLSRMQGIKDGEMRLIEMGGRLNVLRVVASQSAPVSEAAATPRIQQFLFNQRASEAVVAEIKRLKDKAEIAYLGDFAGGAAASEAKAKTASEAKAAELAKAKARAEADTQAKAEARAKADADAQVRSEALTKSRLEAEAKSRLEAEAKAKTAPTQPAQLPQQSIEKGVRGLK